MQTSKQGISASKDTKHERLDGETHLATNGLPTLCSTSKLVEAKSGQTIVAPTRSLLNLPLKYACLEKGSVSLVVLIFGSHIAVIL